MKTIYHLETVREVLAMLREIRSKDDPYPLCEGSLEVRGDDVEVVLVGDPNFSFRMGFKQFVIEMAEMLNLPLSGRDNIPYRWV